MNKKLIIAVCGESGAGKSTTTQFLQDAGFSAYSLSGFLREEAVARYGNVTRNKVQQHGKSMQEAHGNDYYARVLEKKTDLMEKQRAVIDGLRNIDELAYLQDRAKSRGITLKLLALVLDSESRFQRITGRARAGDPTGMEQFEADDARANGSEGIFQNNQALIDAADWRIENSGDMSKLQDCLRELIRNELGSLAAPTSSPAHGEEQ